ncbi:MAG TPA: hypothetical protein PLG20_08785, partial [Candidatus Syntrophosphaera sp.]|nr:hypothetical protein [Candidatus Syntrophosphaera sp.]
MKRIIVFTAVILLLPALAQAQLLPAGPRPRDLASPAQTAVPEARLAPAYTFTKLPTAIIVNYYDYMIGSYSGLPLRVIPPSAGGGYFMTYHGRRQPTAVRRVFFTYIDGQGNISTNNEITSVQNNEGYPGLAVDPVSGKPMYAWHANTDSDAALEVQFTSDAFIAGIPGLWNDIITLVDNPTTVVAPGGITTTDNEFIWPVLTVGPSPIAGKRRIYAAMTNNTTHSAIGVSENVLFAYADFDADAIELGTPLAWSYMTVPELDSWNNDSTVLRRFSGGIIADDAGNLYLAGHHFTVDADDNSITEPDLDVFVCPNYGAGTWTRYSASSRLPSWNPNSSPTDTTGYFKDSDNGDIPYGDNELFWEEGASNSNHFNAVFDPDGHKIIIPSIWSLQNTNGYFYLALQFMKEYEFDIQNHTFGIRDVWPIIDPQDDFNLCFTPWDREAPWGVEDGWDGDEQSGYSPTMATAWPYPHWDDTAHENLMMFRYNNVKLSEPNGQGMMVCLWQDCNRARYFHVYNDTEYSAYANTPEIWISVSPDYGRCWSEPIILNNVDTPEFAGLKPMWAYPADKVVYTGTQGQNL